MCWEKVRRTQIAHPTSFMSHQKMFCLACLPCSACSHGSHQHKQNGYMEVLCVHIGNDGAVSLLPPHSCLFFFLLEKELILSSILSVSAIEINHHTRLSHNESVFMFSAHGKMLVAGM